jgi:hypothetical protein
MSVILWLENRYTKALVLNLHLTEVKLFLHPKLSLSEKILENTSL